MLTSNAELIGVYCLAVLGFSLGLGGLIAYHLSKESKGWQLFPLFYTFTPALTAWIICLIYKVPMSMRSVGLVFTGHWIYYVGAFLMPAVYLGANAIVQTKAGNYTLKKDVQWKEVLVATLIQQLVLVPFIAGEEIGWRGFLQNRLMAEYGLWPSVLIMGLVWGLWHAPLALKGYNLPQHPLWEAFVFYPFVCTCYAAIMVFLTYKTHSALPALWFHTTNNNLGGLSLLVFDKKNERSEIKIYFCIGGLLLLISYFMLSNVDVLHF